MKNLTLFMQFFTPLRLSSLLVYGLICSLLPFNAKRLNCATSNKPLFNQHQIFVIPQYINIDSTKTGFNRAKLGMYFKKNWDFRNAYIGRTSKWKNSNSEQLILPKKIEDYGLVFSDNFDSLNLDIWSKGQPWGRLHPDNVHQFYGDPQAFVGNGCLHLLNEPIPYPIVLKNQTPSDAQRMLKAQIETNIIAPDLVKTGLVDAKGNITTTSEIERASSPITMDIDTNIGIDSTLDKALLIPYSIGVVNTFHSVNFTYGFFAIRSKNPAGPATWPAWWLTGKNNWPPEIDIFEMYGGKTGNGVHTQTMTVHTGKVETHTKQMMMKKIRLKEDTDTAFHIYACLWTPKRIEFYTDNVRVKSIKLNKWMSQFYKEPMYLILNNALENTYIPDLINSGNKTSDFQVDWVKVYQLYAEENHE